MCALLEQKGSNDRQKKKKKSYFGVKNVKKRDERNVNIRFVLRNKLSKSEGLLNQKDHEITNLKDDLTLMTDINSELEKVYMA